MNEQFPKFVIVPYDKLDELLHKVETLNESIASMKMDKGVLGDYISEKEAREILSKEIQYSKIILKTILN